MKAVFTTFMLLAAAAGMSQRPVSLQALQDSARERNRNLQQLALDIEKAEKQYLPYSGIGNTNVQYNFGQIDGPAQDYQWQFQ